MHFAEVFRQYGIARFADYPEIGHDWSVSRENCGLFVPASSESGFDIGFVVEPTVVTVNWGNWHSHYDLDEYRGGAEAFIADLYGLLRDMLSPDMRVRELRARSTPYRGFLESFDGTRWSVEQENGLLFWNYFGRRSVVTYSNSVLPGRMSTNEHDASARL